MKIFTSKQIHELDAYTIEHEPVTSIKLMERSAQAIAHAIAERWDVMTPVVVFAGPGNNGGDALAVARLLTDMHYVVSVYLFNIKNHLTDDCRYNRDRLREMKKLKKFVEVKDEFDPPELTHDTLIVDGLFGSGLNKPLSGGFASLVKYINQSKAIVASIDLPSGLMSEDNTYNITSNIIRASVTFTLQMRKLCMFFADIQQYLGEVVVLDINLSEEWMATAPSTFTLLEEPSVRRLLRPRPAFAHKGTMGNALIVAGSYCMSGASVLAARACLRSGVGKVTVHTPMRNYDVMQISVPEAVLQVDKDEIAFTEAVDLDGYDSLAIGPGLGQRESTAIALITQLRRSNKPTVIDADALNILATRRAWLQQLPQGMLLTPHPKEFDRMEGNDCNGGYDRLSKARDMAQRQQLYILLKGHYSALCCPDGMVIFNSTGNSGMATAGSGDVLTGVISSFMAQGYAVAEAAVIGMYVHGLAGDLAAEEKGEDGLIASDIIDYLPLALKQLRQAE